MERGMRAGLVGWVVALGLAAGAAGQEPPDAGAKPDEVRARLEAKVRRFLEASGQGALAKQACDQMVEQFRQMPGIRAEFLDRFKAAAKPEDMIAFAVPIYLKYLTEADIDALIAFHESPAGRRLAELQPTIMQESMEAGQRWGQELAKRVLREMQGGGADGAEAPPRDRAEHNERATINTLRALCTAQEQWKQQVLVDQDGDGMGEYGWLGELSGIEEIRGAKITCSTSPFVAAILGVKDARGCAQKSGYFYRVFLPTGAGAAAGETTPVDPAMREKDADAQEVRWICYAWPVQHGASGRRTFMASHAGEVYETDGGATPYGGDTAPAVAAALDAEGGAPANLDAGIGLAAAGLKSGDGNEWRPAGSAPRRDAAARAAEEAVRAAEAESQRRAAEKLAREGPWKLSLEKILPGIKRFLNRENTMKRYLGAFSFASDHPEYWFAIRAPFTTDPRPDVEAAIATLVTKLTELQIEGYANAREKGMPMQDEAPPTVHFVAQPGEGKKIKDGEVVAEYAGGRLTWK